MKFLLVWFLLVSISFAEYQKVKIGTIDKHYQSLITQEELIQIVGQIEKLFESQLGCNVFDFSQDGVPINIVYIPASQKKKRLMSKKESMKSLKGDIQTLSEDIQKKKKPLSQYTKKLEKEYSDLNKIIESFNQYVQQAKKVAPQLSREKYEEKKLYILQEEKRINKERIVLDKKKKKHNNKLKTLKRKIRKYNLLVNRHNRLRREVESLSKRIKEIKGVTKGYVKTTEVKETKGGKVVKTTRSKRSYMDKIEIYDFENTQLLQVLLAHELGHLVGLGHINIKGALMHSVVQSEQVENLSLTNEDIQEFYNAFGL